VNGCRAGTEARRHETLLARQSVLPVIYAQHVGLIPGIVYCTAAARTVQLLRVLSTTRSLLHYDLIRQRADYKRLCTIKDAVLLTEV